MNPQDLSQHLLLRESGELPDDASADLEAYLQAHPEAKTLEQEYAALQHAGRFASAECTPALSETSMERIRLAAEKQKPASRTPWLALAAGIVLLLASLPLLIPPDSPSITEEIILYSDSELASSTGELSTELDQLEEEIAAWSDTSTWELLQVEDEAYWAEQLLTSEESI